ncbi:MAG TPA: hypothetical protein DCQ70_06025, partial [Halieaceae bacterium]|nr:hypothetical protein [Halieaceae bacterium]
RGARLRGVQRRRGAGRSVRAQAVPVGAKVRLRRLVAVAGAARAVVTDSPVATAMAMWHRAVDKAAKARLARLRR